MIEQGHSSGRFGWLLYRLGCRGVPGLWRLSGYARPGLDVDHVCPRCYAAWAGGDWFWRWCKRCGDSWRNHLQNAPQEHPELQCRRCGGPNRSWHAPSPLWNAVMRGGSIDGAWEFDELICPTCFMVLAEERGVAEAWRLDARVVHVDLELTTPSGRTWDAETDLWRDGEGSQ